MLFRLYKRSDGVGLLKLLKKYLRDDLNIEIEDDQVEDILKLIETQMAEDISEVAVAQKGNEIVGFVNYQIDSKKSDWCFREGWGTIREIFVDKRHRLEDTGKSLVEYAENRLFNWGADKVYLTSDVHNSFWENLKFTETEVTCEKNKLIVYEKQFKSR